MADTAVTVDDPYKVTAPPTDYSQYQTQSAPPATDQITHAGQRSYQNATLAKLNSRFAWGIHWAIVAFLSLLVWSIGASAPFRTGGIGFAMFCGIVYMFIAIIQSTKYFLRPEALETKIDDVYDKMIPTTAPNQWIRVGWWSLWCLFWLSAWAAVANQNVWCGFGSIPGYDSQCSKSGAVIAFAVFVWFHTLFKVAFCVMDALGKPL
ncbi:hypothetical protein DFJ74DRAFT_702689 [Hyaloraphidium curvatum]|nr:hypothetical protein DFJ74DRAFT_702689 [Hyaloraphidium curvatum]